MTHNRRSPTKNFLLIGVATASLMLAVSAYGWIQLPAGAELPIHWNLAGEIDRTTGKVEGLLALPAISMATFCFLSLIPKIEPSKLETAHSAKVFLATGVVFGAVMLSLQILVVAAALR
jgi:hypothetical protein